MIYRLKTATGIQYPFIKEQLRTVFPQVSFPFPISDETAAEFGCLPVQVIERPAHDPRTQRLEEGDPEELEDGTLRQVLTVREATEAEIAAYDAAHAPTPDWSSFQEALMTSSALNSAFSDALVVAPIAVSLLPLALQTARTGDTTALRGAWQQLIAAEVVTASIRTEIIAAATAAHLPSEVLGIF